MFGENKAVTTESLEEFVARGGKIKKLEFGDSTRKRMEKLQRIHARLVKHDKTEDAAKIKTQIDKYKQVLSRR